MGALRAAKSNADVWRWALSTAALAVAIACSGASKITTVAQARAAWDHLRLAQYSYTVELQCFCTAEMRGPFTVTVKGGNSTVTRDDAVVGPEWLSAVPTNAEALFRFVEERSNQKSFRALFDQATGLPIDVWSDPIPEAADDELGIAVTNITIEEEP